MELVISVVIVILVVEAYAWLPKISEWLIERAVQRLRSEDQDRCREEWKAGLDALPNTVIQLVHALSYLGAANRINADFFENKLAEINALTEECVYEHSREVAIFGAEERDGRLRLQEWLGLYLQISGLNRDFSHPTQPPIIPSTSNSISFQPEHTEPFVRQLWTCGVRQPRSLENVRDAEFSRSFFDNVTAPMSANDHPKKNFVRSA
jgi:hypothetical protein